MLRSFLALLMILLAAPFVLEAALAAAFSVATFMRPAPLFSTAALVAPMVSLAFTATSRCRELLERFCREGLARVRRRDIRRRDRRRAGRGRTRRLAGAAKRSSLTEAIAFPPDMSAAKSRREVGARLGLGAAALVASIVAPAPLKHVLGNALHTPRCWVGVKP